MSLDSSLLEFSRLLSFTADQKRAFELVHDDLSILRKKFNVDRVRPFGSYAKGTGLWFSVDLDIVCFLNDIDPPYDGVNREIVQCIRENIDGVEDFIPGLYRFSTRFTVTRNGFSFQIDIVPAKNMAKGHQGDLVKLQYSNTIELMKTLDDDGRDMYKAALCESAVNFITDQHEAIHDLIRLAKCWLFANMEKKLPDGNLDSELRNFAKSLTITEHQQKVLRRVVGDLNKVLGQRFRPDRILAAGSFAKETCLWFTLELDIVMFLNEDDQPIRKTIDEIEICVRREINGYVKSHVRGYTTSITLERDGITFNVDVVPAINMARGHYQNRIDLQYQNTIGRLSYVNSDERPMYNKGLTEQAVKFIKCQSDGVKDLIVLAKAWLFVNMDKRMPGGYSSAIESVAVCAGHRTEVKPGIPFSLTDGFKRFLGLMVNIDNNMHIRFDRQSMSDPHYPAHYDRDNIPQDISSQKPLLMDTVDPCNNRLNFLNMEILTKLANSARQSLNRWKEITEIRTGSNDLNNLTNSLNIRIVGDELDSSRDDCRISLPTADELPSPSLFGKILTWMSTLWSGFTRRIPSFS